MQYLINDINNSYFIILVRLLSVFCYIIRIINYNENVYLL